MRACFGQDFKETGVVCASYSRALSRHKKTGKTSPPCDVESPTTPVWTTETTEFGPIQRGPFGQVLLPPGIFEEILENKENLVNSGSLKEELNKVKAHMYKEFVKNWKNPIYENQFRRFCQATGAQTLFDDILSSVTYPRHSENRLKLNEKRVVGIIYNLVYCLSQWCNTMQVDQALYLQTSHANQEAILTEHQLGNTCSRRLMNNIRKSLSSNHRDDLQQFFADAIKNEWLLVLVTDDYTTIHTIRRPTQTNSPKPTICAQSL
ncbi:Hypothetical predicted protein [Paramuricea clavata]|uniref:Uncharacterized protein n=1 Tax=Paramuricea clavata TaxID=317549 RepID=A0A6S7FF09_PARCT|nr:Hypothetical predicted protein [Paramuricea clavata]